MTLSAEQVAEFLRQNPGFFDAPSISPKAPQSAPTNPPKDRGAGKKLSYKDQRRLEELEGLVAKLPADIAAMEARLEDPGFYARDPKGFDTVMKAMDKARADLSAAEEEWLGLEEKREALG